MDTLGLSPIAPLPPGGSNQAVVLGGAASGSGAHWSNAQNDFKFLMVKFKLGYEAPTFYDGRSPMDLQYRPAHNDPTN
uniref:Uncharacterized protein n=1 Tax=Ditylenchus dipsaci TaxID=166011 RepID=A0A915EKN3_9BILA